VNAVPAGLNALLAELVSVEMNQYREELRRAGSHLKLNLLRLELRAELRLDLHAELRLESFGAETYSRRLESFDAETYSRRLESSDSETYSFFRTDTSSVS